MNTNNLSRGTASEQISETASQKQRGIVTRVLSPALGLWLRSQVQEVSKLEVEISGGDRQILTGYMPRVSISACQAVYRGLHLSYVQLTGKDIRINIGQVLKGQPLRLLEPVPIEIEFLVRESDLNASLQSPLLSDALTNLLSTLLPNNSLMDTSIDWHKLSIDRDHLTLEATTIADTLKPIGFRTGLKLASRCELCLEQPQIQGRLGPDWEDLADYKLDMGPEVDVRELTLAPGQIVCCGRINVAP